MPISLHAKVISKCRFEMSGKCPIPVKTTVQWGPGDVDFGCLGKYQKTSSTPEIRNSGFFTAWFRVFSFFRQGLPRIRFLLGVLRLPNIRCLSSFLRPPTEGKKTLQISGTPEIRNSGFTDFRISGIPEIRDSGFLTAWFRMAFLISVGGIEPARLFGPL